MSVTENQSMKEGIRMGKVYRNELKYMINNQQAKVISSRLAHICELDKNTDEKGFYRVSSLYFDDYIDSGMHDKLDGIDRRKKFRIRIYNGGDEIIKLERKAKNINVCVKDSVTITRDEYDRILAGNLAFLQETDKPMLVDFYQLYQTRKLRPKVIVDYQRKAYIYRYGNVRVTMDVKMSGSIGRCDLFSDAAYVPAMDNNQTILEVKFTGFLPEVIRDMIQHGSGNMQAISKYAKCRMLG